MTALKTLVALLVVSSVGFAETPEQFFDQANQAYQKGNFAQAIEKYEQIAKGGLVSGQLFYNLGNAYYKSGNVSKAILNYERAIRLLPDDDDVRHNLQLANLMIADRIEPAPRLFVWDWWDGVKSQFSLSGITWVGYVLFVLVILSMMGVLLAPSYTLRRAAFVGSIGLSFFFALSVLVFAGKLNEAQDKESAIVVTTIATVKNSPDPNSSDAFVLHGGVKVRITDKVNDWIKIRLADGKVGWMEEKSAEVI